MENNAVLRSMRYALNINDSKMAKIFSATGETVDASKVSNLLKQEIDEGYIECSKELLLQFLDGFIITKRGPRDDGKPALKNVPLNNNLILKKIRIALEYKEADMISTFEKGGYPISKPELSAFFRRRDHKHYKECGDQLMRKFLKGLSVK